ncbi:glycosyltransferase family 4 protein [Planctomycetota bacterium]
MRCPVQQLSCPTVLIGIPCLMRGGTEIQTRALVDALSGGGYEVVVCCYYEHDAVVVEEMREAGARVVLLGLIRRLPGRNFHRMPRLAAALRNVFRRERPDFFHVQYLAPGAFPVLVARLCRVPKVVATLHTPGHMYRKGAFSPKRVANRFCDAFICVSRAAERSVFGDAELFQPALLGNGRRHFTIYNAVDLDEADRLIDETDPAQLRERLGLGEGPVVGIVARLSREKGHAFFFRAFAEVVQEMPGLQLLVVGDGKCGAELRELAGQLGIASHIVWAGRLPREEALRSYMVMDIVAVPSLYEGFGLSAVEAMAFGKPVVASDVDELGHVVAHGTTGTLVPYGDVEAMRESVLELLRSPELVRKMGEAGRRRVVEHFNLPRFRAAWLSLYERLGTIPSATSAKSTRGCHRPCAK